MTQPTEGTMQVPTAWDPAVQTMPTFAANTFSMQVTGAGGPEEIVVSIGYAAPPVFAGTIEEQMRQAASLEAVLIRPVVRLSITPGRLRELLEVLQTVVSGLDGQSENGEAT